MRPVDQGLEAVCDLRAAILTATNCAEISSEHVEYRCAAARGAGHSVPAVARLAAPERSAAPRADETQALA
jgi:hypothetical protein